MPVTIKPCVEFVTPGAAATMLAANTHNRRVIPGHLRRLEATFRAGGMKLNGDAIRVSETGVLLDGQHRLMACANTGVGFHTLVVRGLPDDCFDTIDQTHASRKLSCVFSISGESHYKTLASVLLHLHEFKESSGQIYSGGAKHFLSASAARELLEKHPGVRESVSFFQTKTNYVWRTWTPSLLHYLFSQVDASVAESFREVLLDGSTDKDRPFNKLRESLIKARAMGNLDQRYDAARAIRAFNAELAGVNPKILMWTSAMAFPAIEGLDVASL